RRSRRRPGLQVVMGTGRRIAGLVRHWPGDRPRGAVDAPTLDIFHMLRFEHGTECSLPRNVMVSQQSGIEIHGKSVRPRSPARGLLARLVVVSIVLSSTACG